MTGSSRRPLLSPTTRLDLSSLFTPPGFKTKRPCRQEPPAYAKPSHTSASRLEGLVESPLWREEVCPQLDPVSLVQLSHVNKNLRASVMR